VKLLVQPDDGIEPPLLIGFWLFCCLVPDRLNEGEGQEARRFQKSICGPGCATRVVASCDATCAARVLRAA
jgi:hypothetical protein